MPDPTQPKAGADLQGLIDTHYLNREQLARELKITVRAIDRMRALGTAPPSVKVGKRLFFRRDAVMAWLERQEDPRRFLGRRSAKIREAIA